MSVQTATPELDITYSQVEQIEEEELEEECEEEEETEEHLPQEPRTNEKSMSIKRQTAETPTNATGDILIEKSSSSIKKQHTNLTKAVGTDTEIDRSEKARARFEKSSSTSEEDESELNGGSHLKKPNRKKRVKKIPSTASSPSRKSSRKKTPVQPFASNRSETSFFSKRKKSTGRGFKPNLDVTHLLQIASCDQTSNKAASKTSLGNSKQKKQATQKRAIKKQPSSESKRVGRKRNPSSLPLSTPPAKKKTNKGLKRENPPKGSSDCDADLSLTSGDQESSQGDYVEIININLHEDPVYEIEQRDLDAILDGYIGSVPTTRSNGIKQTHLIPERDSYYPTLAIRKDIHLKLDEVIRLKDAPFNRCIKAILQQITVQRSSGQIESTSEQTTSTDSKLKATSDKLIKSSFCLTYEANRYLKKLSESYIQDLIKTSSEVTSFANKLTVMKPHIIHASRITNRDYKGPSRFEKQLAYKFACVQPKRISVSGRKRKVRKNPTSKNLVQRV